MTRPGALMATRYDDVTALYKDPRFASDVIRHGRQLPLREWSRRLPLLAPLAPRMFRILVGSMVFKDDPEHRRLRNAVDQAFAPGKVAALTQDVGYACDDLLNNIAGRMQQGDTVDLVAEFALPLPLIVISRMLGIPDCVRRRFHGLVRSFLEAPGGGVGQLLAAVGIAHKMLNLFEGIVEQRTREPDGRVIAQLIELERAQELSRNDTLAMIFLLLLAGHDTVTSLIASGTLALLDHPEQFMRLRESPQLIEPAVEELLRYTSPVTCGAVRIAVDDVELGGRVVARGSNVIGMLNSANRDQATFADADTLLLDRQPNSHIAFGSGAHLCLGIWLARLQARHAFAQLADRFPNLQLGVPRSHLRWQPSQSVRGLQQLPVRLG